MINNAAFHQIPKRAWEGLSPDFPNGRFRLTATCSEPGCDAVLEKETREMFTPSAAVARFKRLGWRLGKHVKCPAHAGKSSTKGKETEMPEAARNVVTMSAPRPPAAPATPAKVIEVAESKASEAAKRVKRMVYMALEDYYDDTRKAYKPGHSDATIAKELECAEEFVAKIRGEDFGPAGEPPELQALRKQLDDASGFLRKMRVDCTAAIDRLRSECEAMIAGAEKRVTAAEQAFDKAALTNGWKR